MRFSQILSESEKELYEAQTAALLQPNKKANFGAAPTGYSGTTTKVNPSNIQTPQKKSIPAATPVKGAYSAAGSTAPAAPGTIPNKAATAAPQPAGASATTPATAQPAGSTTPQTNGQATAAPAGATATTPATAAQTNSQATQATGNSQPAPAGGKVSGFLRGAGNLASQTIGGVSQAAGAGIGGFQRGLAGGRQGQNFSSIAPTYNKGADSNNPNSADNIVSQQAAGAGSTPSAYTAAGNAELSDLRSRLDSLEQLIKSKP
jgi:hypothetical protein